MHNLSHGGGYTNFGRGVPHPGLAKGVPHHVLAVGYPILSWSGGYPILTWLGNYPFMGYPHLGLGYPPGRDLGPVTGHPRKELGPGEVLWNGDGVLLGKDTGPVEVLWDGDGVPLPGGWQSKNITFRRTTLAVIITTTISSQVLVTRSRRCHTLTTWRQWWSDVNVVRHERSYKQIRSSTAVRTEVE